MPKVADGGKTCTFRIRPGYRFSPPSNAPVTAETFSCPSSPFRSGRRSSTADCSVRFPRRRPYYLEQKFLDERVVLERNPNYHGPRPHRLQRIVYDINNSTRRTVGLINAGKADYAADMQHLSVFAKGGPLDQRFGHGPDQRLALTPQVGLRYVQLNTGRGLFRDARLRRAVSYAIDRRALASADDGRWNLGLRPSRVSLLTGAAGVTPR